MKNKIDLQTYCSTLEELNYVNSVLVQTLNKKNELENTIKKFEKNNTIPAFLNEREKLVFFADKCLNLSNLEISLALNVSISRVKQLKMAIKKKILVES